MELQAARADGLQQRVGSGREQDERGRFGRLFEDLEEQVGVSPAHGVGAVEDKDAATAVWLEVSGALHGAQLADADHRDARPECAGARGRELCSQTSGMRLDDAAAYARRHGGVRAFAALGESQRQSDGWGIGKRSAIFLQAGRALAAEVVLETLAIGGLSEHARQSVLADAARAGEKQRAGNAFAAEHTAQGADDAFVA
jgi:hypothetical protein